VVVAPGLEARIGKRAAEKGIFYIPHGVLPAISSLKSAKIEVKLKADLS
jgi:hypothetical protein